MSNLGPKSLSELILEPGSALQDLARQAARRVDLAGHLRAGLPVELRAHLLAGNLRDDGTLVLITDSPAWAARLRFEGEQLLVRCREVYPQSQRVKVRVGAPAAVGPAGP